ncbi:uncharacterized protein LOC118517309 [Anopheles stephensi]|nr:uncharacterized protein LOC118515624 [Anopheles stephensi]XP_035917941.1 uncharacterized protein LOC118515699 [Anopheles stephensi]XP_035917945.1 uncharacterized protein LOC118515725 [Anopheles stephensi]XP_035917951.1 uncharacterized protein LOC118515754 [Anopheles stephensi]XP_035917967.1 uncharacterized protein LOC118515887 [Anopheles stephensi]XP_035918006.1 uncharacterized protein LOC118516230 [Anopheles stephensi]XP_035918516.1 uncharacterized protein LOC118516659 [Anopheles stephens
MYVKLRSSQELQDVRADIGMGRRTAQGHLIVPIRKNVDSAELARRIQLALGEDGVVRVVTEMGELLVTNIDSLAEKSDVELAIKEKLGAEPGIARVELWELRDGTKRARVRLPLAKARLLIGQKLTLCQCVSGIREVPKKPLDRQRCFRCLLMGHLARNCRASSDRSGLCLQCGEEGHRISQCTSAAKCIVCQGPHRVGHSSCRQNQHSRA